MNARIEKLILQHTHTALDNKYFGHLVDYDIDLIEEDIPMVLNSLFTNYGKVQSEELKIKEAEVLNLTFNPIYPIVTLYRPIE